MFEVNDRHGCNSVKLMLCCHLSVELVAEWEEGENQSQDISGCLDAQIHLQKDRKNPYED